MVLLLQSTCPMKIKVIVIINLVGSLAYGQGCMDLFDNYFFYHESGRIQFGEVRANARVYPKDYTLHSVGFSENEILNMKGRVLLVGEGYGQLLPIFIRNPHVQVTAIDPIYSIKDFPNGFMGRSLRTYVDKYSLYLDPSYSANLSNVPNDSVDLYIANFLINNMLEFERDNSGQIIPGQYVSSPNILSTIKEALRVLKPGGKAIFTGFMSGAKSIRFEKSLAESYKGPLDYLWKTETFQVITNFNSFGELAPDLIEMPVSRDTITRITITKKPRTILYKTPTAILELTKP